MLVLIDYALIRVKLKKTWRARIMFFYLLNFAFTLLHLKMLVNVTEKAPVPGMETKTYLILI